MDGDSMTEFRLDIQGLSAEEHRLLSVIACTADPREVVVLRLAKAMSDDAEQSGALWLVRKVIARRRGTS